tara:strand:+ start:373 stop:624 length:252 start_codon:yes stop_codon:yes gene_type:complete
MLKLYTIILILFGWTSLFSENKENQSNKPQQNSNQNLKNQQSGENIDNLLKQIESARKQLKSQELRLQDIQNKIIKRRLNKNQ